MRTESQIKEMRSLAHKAYMKKRKECNKQIKSSRLSDEEVDELALSTMVAARFKGFREGLDYALGNMEPKITRKKKKSA